MKKIETIYLDNTTGTVNLIQAKVSENSKIGIGYIVQTYHFSIEQVKTGLLTNDEKNCLNCPLSYNQNNGKSGGCYTHKGMQLMGLKSMLKRLQKMYFNGQIQEFNDLQIDNFVSKVLQTYKVDLIRFGAYGEPILLGEETVKKLTFLTRNFTGYSHQYKNEKNQWAAAYFMASVHDQKDLDIANYFKFRSFIAKEKNIDIDGVNCPASKESTLNLSCIACKLCNGNSKGIKKNVFINIH